MRLKDIDNIIYYDKLNDFALYKYIFHNLDLNEDQNELLEILFDSPEEDGELKEQLLNSLGFKYEEDEKCLYYYI